jgi:hypothetical protein
MPSAEPTAPVAVEKIKILRIDVRVQRSAAALADNRGEP